jgi:hypothetical protein
MAQFTGNEAAWIRQAKTQLEVGPAPDPLPAPNEVVIHNRYVAVNPGTADRGVVYLNRTDPSR